MVAGRPLGETAEVDLRPGFGIRLEAAQRLLDESVAVGALEAEWPAGRVKVSAYVGAAQLPTEIPGRVRCLVTARDCSEVLVTWDVNGTADCLPGGGAEPGESVAETAYREVWEETGWHIEPASVRVLGWLHIESFAPPDPAHPFPHPDGFMTVVHAVPARADDEHETWTDVEGFIVRSAFVSVRAIPTSLRTSPIHAPYLDAVLGPAR